MSKEFDPKNIIDFNKDYYSILGISKENLPDSKGRQNKIEISQIIEKAYRKQARKAHPDFGGSKDAFLDLVRARRILEDPYLKKIFDQGHFDEFELISEDNAFNIDWKNVGNYRKGTPEDTIGFQLFFMICDNKSLNLTPAFFPKSEEHNYEWDWVISERKKLALSIVNDENEVLRLTSGENVEDALPFKIYICIPQTNLNFARKQESIQDPNGNVLINSEISAVSYNDYNLLETTNLNTALQYINELLFEDLENYKNGTLDKINKIETKWLDTKAIKQFDIEQLKNILNLRSYSIVEDDKADDFLDNIDKSEENFEDLSNQPNLPYEQD
jgi:hypothetical protein